MSNEMARFADGIKISRIIIFKRCWSAPTTSLSTGWMGYKMANDARLKASPQIMYIGMKTKNNLKCWIMHRCCLSLLWQSKKRIVNLWWIIQCKCQSPILLFFLKEDWLGIELKIKLPIQLDFYITTGSLTVIIYYYNIRKLNSLQTSVGNVV